MFQKVKLHVLFIVLVTTSATAINTPVKEKIDAIITEYTSQINNLLSKQNETIKLGEDYFVQIRSSVLDDVDHSNDLKYFELAPNKNAEIRLTDYITLLADDYKGIVKGEFIDTSIIIDECPVAMNGQEVYLVSLQKELFYNGQSKAFNFLIGVNLDAEYPIRFAFFNEIARSEKDIPINTTCTTNAQKEEIENIRKQQFIALKNEADAYYIAEDYYNAKKSYTKALMLNPENQDVIDGIENATYFIEETRKEIITSLIAKEQYENALEELNKVTAQQEVDPWYNTQKALCETNLEKIKNNKELDRADALFNNHQTQKASDIYKSLLNTPHIDQAYLKNQIKKCEESDPNYIQKQLQKAYNNAVESKKNYLATFKTYSKFQNSGLLNGEQYYFMCLMMINKHSAVAKPMGFSKNQAKLLSRVYFYKAKDLGINVSFLETQIFTKNIENRKK